MTALDTLCVEITARCPLRCVHCSANASPERTEMMNPEVFFAAISQLPKLKEIYISGGEPFEHPALDEFVRVAAARASAVVIYSSGTILDATGRIASIPEQRLVGTVRARLSRIDISLYAARASDHDRITNTPGSFERTLATLRRLRLLGIPFGVHFVPIGDAGEQVLRTAELAREMGAMRFHILNLAPQGRGHGLHAEAAVTLLPKLEALHQRTSPMDVIVSSKLRAAMGAVASTERDRLRVAMLDVAGYLYPGEGYRLPTFRSDHTITERAMNELLEELANR